jgi:hypothetical protein
LPARARPGSMAADMQRWYGDRFFYFGRSPA